MFQKRRPCNPQTKKGLETIEILSQNNFAITYTDGSSDRSLSNGGAGIILLLPDGNNYKHKINTGIISSNFTSELMAIREALILYQQDPHVIDSTEGLVIFSDSKSAIEAIRNGETNISCDIITLLEQLHSKRKSCILQWIPRMSTLRGEAGRVIERIDRQNSRSRTAKTTIIKFGLHASFVELESTKSALNENELSFRLIHIADQNHPWVAHRTTTRARPTDRRGQSHPPQCTTSREDRQIVHMTVTDRSVTSRTVAQHIESATHHSVFARTIRRRLQQSGLSARRPLLSPPLTQNHRRLRRQWCDERRMWAAEWNEVILTDESRICLQHHDGWIRVRDTVER
ncbi:transposable element Tcb1 transposase [Trichonephila clavipes]|nr:transposable element Tcb1 transposase [Trichonephila clavipes]